MILYIEQEWGSLRKQRLCRLVRSQVGKYFGCEVGNKKYRTSHPKVALMLRVLLDGIEMTVIARKGTSASTE